MDSLRLLACRNGIKIPFETFYKHSLKFYLTGAIFLYLLSFAFDLFTNSFCLHYCQNITSSFKRRKYYYESSALYISSNKVKFKSKTGMKIHGCSCSFVFAVFNNFNKTRVRVRSYSIFSKTNVFGVRIRVRCSPTLRV